MSSALAIASVTQVLKDILHNGLNEPDLPGVSQLSATVSALPLDKIEVGAQTEDNRLNLFMYMTTPNQGWRNHNFPTYTSQGERINNPPLALDLYYVLSAYGNDELNNDILLGYGMQILHETPVLDRQLITTLLNSSELPDRLKDLSTSQLAEQVEQLKITPAILNTEEISRLWTAFGVKYRPSAFYKVTVVLIESQQSTKAPLPVQQPKLYIQPFQQPTIEKISAQTALGEAVLYNQKILPDHLLVISGTNLNGDTISVTISDTKIEEASFTISSDDQIILPLPNDLIAGIQNVQVAYGVLMGSPPTPHKGFTSNVETFVLSPEIDTITLHDEPEGKELEIKVKPTIGDHQQVFLLLNELNVVPPTIPQSYSIERAISSPPTLPDTAVFPVDAVKAGTYLIRIRVDDAESPISTDFNSPNVTI